MKIKFDVEQGFLGLNAKSNIEFEGTLTEWLKCSKELNIDL